MTTDHDPLCLRTHVGRCDVCALIARVRADERQLVGRVWAKREDLRDAHVEAVAARLVEVICEDDLWRELLEAKLDRISLMWRAACKERDAARAEVARLRSPEWEAEVRADERERIVAELDGPAQESEAMYAHAEAVAARLVEVICDDEHWRREDSFREIKRLIAQRDAARAEVASFSAEIDRMVGELSIIRMEHEAEVAALRERLETARADALAEFQGATEMDRRAWRDEFVASRVLADLRAKVEGLATWDGYYEPVVVRREVLALIEEAGRG